MKIHTKLSCITKIPFFEAINKIATIHETKKKLAKFQQDRKNKGKRGGVTANTFDVFFALLSCVAPTMADIQANQPEVLKEAIQNEELFCFTYNKTLKTKINNLKNLEVLQIHENTVKNHIKVLLKAGILTRKVNYNKTGDNPKTRGFENPTPADANPKGRGKIQLFFSKDVLILTHNAHTQFATIRQSLSQYTASCFLSVPNLLQSLETESIKDKGTECGEVVPAIAGAKTICKEIKEQERKFLPQTQLFAAQFSNKNHFFASRLFELCRWEIFPQQEFNLAIQQSGQNIIQQHLEQLAQTVQEYRSAKIKSYCQCQAYLEATPAQQTRKLKYYSSNLPHPHQAAIEIFANAIQKQAKHATKYGYISKFGYPPDFLTSTHFIKAIDYSISDWSRIQNRFFAKNLKFSAYFEELKKIGSLYTNILEQSAESLAYGYRLTLDGHKRFQERLANNEQLTDSNKQALAKIFTNRFGPLFSQLSLQAKKQIKLANHKKTA